MSTRIAQFSLALAVLASAACSGTEGGKKATVSKATLLSSVTMASKSANTSLVLGTPVTGALEASDPVLSDDSHFDQWTYDGRRGERIQITLTSADFDAFLLLGSPSSGSSEVIGEDDDSGGGTDARITVELPADGSYLVFANSYEAGATGAYTLRIDPAPAGSVTQNPTRTPIDYVARYPGGGDPKGRYALLVGIEDYRGSGASSLPGTVQDARLIGRILVERYGFAPANVLYITDREATREHIMEAFRRHLGQAGPDGVAVFYYSGHGTQLDSNRGTQDTETDNSDEALAVWGDDGRGGLILDDELGVLANDLNTERALLILDSCFSGTGSRGADAGTGMPKEVEWDSLKAHVTVPTTFATSAAAKSGNNSDGLAEPDQHLLLAASAEDQVSWTGGGWPKYTGTNSVFTYFLAESLEAASPNATFAQVMATVTEKTDTYVQENHNLPQTPRPEGRRSSTSIREFLRQR